MLKMSLVFILFLSCYCYGFDIVYETDSKAVYGVKVSTKTATESNRIDITGIGFSIAGANPDKLKILDVQLPLPKDLRIGKTKKKPITKM